MADSPFRRPEARSAPLRTGGPGSSEGEESEPTWPMFLYAFSNRPVRILWLDPHGNKLREQLVEYEAE